MRRYAVLDLQADCRLYADLKEQGDIERRLKKKNLTHARPPERRRQTVGEPLFLFNCRKEGA